MAKLEDKLREHAAVVVTLAVTRCFVRKKGFTKDTKVWVDNKASISVLRS